MGAYFSPLASGGRGGDNITPPNLPFVRGGTFYPPPESKDHAKY